MAQWDTYTNMNDTELLGVDELAVWDISVSQLKNITVEEFRQWVVNNSGVLAGLDSVSGSEIAAAAVSNDKLSDMSQSTIKGRASGSGTGSPVDLTAGQLQTIISGTGLDADTLDGQHGSYYNTWGNLTGTPTTLSGYGITNAVPLTGSTAVTGDFATTGSVLAGKGSGGPALTTNDGQGNANVTFNHEDGIAEQAGNAARIVVNTDSTSGVSMSFELLSNAAAGAVSTVPKMTLTESSLSVVGSLNCDSTLTLDSTDISESSDGLLLIQGASGYVQIGTQDTSWGRIQTDRAKFYTNKPWEITTSMTIYGTSIKTDATGFWVDGTRYLRAVTGNYGSVQVGGAGVGSYSGYSINATDVFMSNGTTAGLYNDTNNEWMCTGTHNGAFTLYDNGVAKLATTSGGVNVTGTLDASTLVTTPSVACDAASGNGVRFWGNAVTYSIYMSATADATYGGAISGAATSDYNMYYRMSGGTNRGFVWQNSTTERMQLEGSGNLVVSGNVTAYSDKRAKDNIEKIDDALYKIGTLNGYTFDRVDTPELGRQTGVIAQEVLEVLPEAVQGTDDTGYAVAYGNMVGLLIEGIKELTQENADLSRRLQDLEEKFL